MRIFRLFAIMLFTVCISSLYAQWSPPTTIHTPYGNVTTPGMYVPAFYGNYGNKNVYKNSQYKVVLLNDSIITGKGTIKDKGKTSFLVMKETKRIIYPTETKSITLFLKKDTVNGTPFTRDSVWLVDKTEKEKKDEIGIITIYPMSFENNTTYILDSTGKIREATRDYLLPIIGNDKKAKKQLDNWKIGQAIGTYNSHLKKSEKK